VAILRAASARPLLHSHVTHHGAGAKNAGRLQRAAPQSLTKSAEIAFPYHFFAKELYTEIPGSAFIGGS
jgi:hypothetical protein